MRGELTGLQRATLGALVVMDVHARDVVTAMVAKAVTSAGDFEWQAQLRSYWEENEAAAAHGGDSSGRQGPTVMMRWVAVHIARLCGHRHAWSWRVRLEKAKRGRRRGEAVRPALSTSLHAGITRRFLLPAAQDDVRGA